MIPVHAYYTEAVKGQVEEDLRALANTEKAMLLPSDLASVTHPPSNKLYIEI